MRTVLARVPVILLVVALLTSLLPVLGSADSVAWEKIDPGLRALMAQQPQRTFSVIVEAATDVASKARGAPGAERARRAAARIGAHKGRVKAPLGIIGSASGSVDYAAIAALSRDPAVAYIHYDAPIRRLEVAPVANVFEQVVKATDVWNLGLSGKGVGVAVLDSGVYGSPDLSLPSSRVAAHVDFVGDGAASADPGGHGTHVAGIIAGNGYAAPAGMTSAYAGVAPGAHIVDVRVIDGQGHSNMSNLIAGVQWVVKNRKTYNIRVANLSLGGSVSSGYTYKTDPLVAALDVAWLSGITVVAAAGNSGPGPGTIETPGTSPMVVTVGAIDDNGTTDVADDSVPSWSSQGPTPDRLSKPDLVAPGRRIISLFSPGSYLVSSLPDRITTTTAGTYLRLSGTSMATPVVSGVVALLLEKNPGLKPDQIKKILAQTSRALPGYGTGLVGAGRVDARAAVDSPLAGNANLGKRPADAFARAVFSILKGQPLTWRDMTYAGRNWANITWDNIQWDNITWDNIMWDNIMWDNIMWDNIMWDNITWDTTWSSMGQDSVTSSSANID